MTGIVDDVRTVLEAVLPLVPAAGLPWAPVVMAVTGLVANVVARRQATPAAAPVDPALAARVFEAMLARDAATLAACDVVRAREVAHAAYLRAKLGAV